MFYLPNFYSFIFNFVFVFFLIKIQIIFIGKKVLWNKFLCY